MNGGVIRNRENNLFTPLQNVWVKKCCRIWLDQNFDPPLLTNKLWLVPIWKKEKKKFEKKINMTDSKKNNIFQDHQFSIFFLNRTDWFEGPKNTKKCIFCLFSDFLCAIELTFLLAVLKWIEINYEVEHSFFFRRYFFNFGIHYYVLVKNKF